MLNSFYFNSGEYNVSSLAKRIIIGIISKPTVLKTIIDTTVIRTVEKVVIEHTDTEDIVISSVSKTITETEEDISVVLE